MLHFFRVVFIWSLNLFLDHICSFHLHAVDCTVSSKEDDFQQTYSVPQPSSNIYIVNVLGFIILILFYYYLSQYLRIRVSCCDFTQTNRKKECILQYKLKYTPILSHITLFTGIYMKYQYFKRPYYPVKRSTAEWNQLNRWGVGHWIIYSYFSP